MEIFRFQSIAGQHFSTCVRQYGYCLWDVFERKNDRKTGILKPENFVESLIELQKNFSSKGPLKVILSKPPFEIAPVRWKLFRALSRWFLNTWKAWRSNKLPTQPVPLFGHPHGEKVFPNIHSEFLHPSFCLLLLLLLFLQLNSDSVVFTPSH